MRQLYTFLLFIAFSAAIAQPEQIKADNFNSIKIFGPFKVTLIKANASRAEIDYQDIDSEDVMIKHDNSGLQIKLRTRSIFDFNDDKYRHKGRTYATVKIYYTSLVNIEARAGAIIRSSETIKAKSLSLISKMGADIRLDINTEELNLDSSMGSEVELTGIAQSADIKSKMGSHVSASKLQSQTMTVSSSMGSDVSVFAEQELNASADFGATISYTGSPAHKSTSQFLGAEINPRRK